MRDFSGGLGSYRARSPAGVVCRRLRRRRASSGIWPVRRRARSPLQTAASAGRESPSWASRISMSFRVISGFRYDDHPSKAEDRSCKLRVCDNKSCLGEGSICRRRKPPSSSGRHPAPCRGRQRGGPSSPEMPRHWCNSTVGIGRAFHHQPLLPLTHRPTFSWSNSAPSARFFPSSSRKCTNSFLDTQSHRSFQNK